MQLAYSDVFNEKEGCGKLIQDAFKAMSNFHSGKGTLVFLEAAAKLTMLSLQIRPIKKQDLLCIHW